MEDESNLAPKLMNDIQTFLENRGAVITNDDDDEGEEGFSSLSDTESEDHTLKNDDRHPIRVGGGFDGDTSDIENYDSDDWCSVDSAESGANQQNRVHFDDKDQVMNFSPPRMPKNAPSYLIWSIFTKEREERRRKKSSSANLAERQNGKVRQVALSLPPFESEIENSFFFIHAAYQWQCSKLFSSLQGQVEKVNFQQRRLSQLFASQLQTGRVGEGN